MKENKSIIVGSIILIIFGLGYFSYTKWYGGGSKESLASITSFTVEKPDFVVKGIKLSSVEIWAVPSGTGITEKDYVMLGKAA